MLLIRCVGISLLVNQLRNHRNMGLSLMWLAKPMGFACRGVWVMGYCGPMGYGMQFPANQVGGQLRLWDIRGYGLSEVWVMRGSTVHSNHDCLGLTTP
jgi:hypothetical protein